ncbi:hypothetical protein EDD37DRAFT_208457 [Exophiala viscosa]|uniref:uncharacterized protein n=1 Tax=Exophiala viscosa TaxID=2486360 RepID=UPI00219DA743|nr:hypothetical protein EDD37DRAFT_208457 [Exophiala viscosa]
MNSSDLYIVDEMEDALNAALDELRAPNRQPPGEDSDEESASQEAYTEVGLGQVTSPGRRQAVISPGRRQRPPTPGWRPDRNTPKGIMSPGSDHSEALADLGLHDHSDAKNKLPRYIPESDQRSTSSGNVPIVKRQEENEMSIDHLPSQVVGSPVVTSGDLASAHNLEDYYEAGRQSDPSDQKFLLSPRTHNQPRYGDKGPQQQGEEEQHVQIEPEQQGEKNLKLEERLDKLLAENAMLKMEKDFVVKEANTLHERNAVLFKDLSKSQKDLSTARNEMARRLAHKEELLKIAESSLEESQKSAEPLIIAQQRIRHQEKEKSSLEEMIILANTATREAQQKHTQHESRIVELQEQLDLMTAWMENIPQEMRTCQKECESLKAELKRCVERMEKLRSAQQVYDLEQMDFHDRCLPILLDQISINDFRLPLKPSAAEVIPLGEYMASPIESTPSNRQSMANGVDTPLRHMPPTGLVSSNKPRPQSWPVPRSFSPDLNDSFEVALDATHPTFQSTSTESQDGLHTGVMNDDRADVLHVSSQNKPHSTNSGEKNARAEDESGTTAISESPVDGVGARLSQSLTKTGGVSSQTRSQLKSGTLLETGAWRARIESPDTDEGAMSTSLEPLLVDTTKATVVASCSAVESPQSPGLRKRSSVSTQNSPHRLDHRAAFEDAMASTPRKSQREDEMVGEPRILLSRLPGHGRPQASRTHSLYHERPAMIMADSRRGRPHSWDPSASRSISSQKSADSGYDSDAEQIGIASSTAPANAPIGDDQQVTPTYNHITPPASSSARTSTTFDGCGPRPSSSDSLDVFGAFSPLTRQVSDPTTQASTNIGSFFESSHGESDCGTVATGVSDANSVVEPSTEQQRDCDGPVIVLDDLRSMAELSEAPVVESAWTPCDTETEAVRAHGPVIVREAESRLGIHDAEDAGTRDAENDTRGEDDVDMWNPTPSGEDTPFFTVPPNKIDVRKRRFSPSILTALLCCALVLTSGLLAVWSTGPWSIQSICQRFANVSSTLYPIVTITEEPFLPALSALEESSPIIAIHEVSLADTVTTAALEAILPLYISDYSPQVADDGTLMSTREWTSTFTAPSLVYKGQPGRTGPAPASPVVLKFDPPRTNNSSPSTSSASSCIEESNRFAPPSISTRTVTVAITRACPDSDRAPPSVSIRTITVDSPCPDQDFALRAVEVIRHRLPESTKAHASTKHLDFTDTVKFDVNSSSYTTRAYAGSGHWDFVPSVRRWIDQVRFDVTVQVIQANGGRYSW